MSNRVVETIYRLRDRATEVLRRIGGGYRGSAKDAERASQRIEAANRRQRTSAQGVLATVGKLRFAYFALAGAIVGAVRGFARAAQAASDQENAERRLETALKNGKGATDEQIEALLAQAKAYQQVTRFGDEQTISAQAQLATFQLNSDAIQELVPRALDLAEGMRRLGKDNVDVEQAAILLGKALRGNVGDLSRYGIVLTDAQKETVNFGNEQEKVAALAEAIDANYKGLAQSLSPYEQAVQRSSNGVGDFVERLGAFITTSPAVTDAINSITDAFGSLGDTLEEKGGSISRFITVTVESFKTLAAGARTTFNIFAAGAGFIERTWTRATRMVAKGLSFLTTGEAKRALSDFVDEADARLAELERKGAARLENLQKASRDFVDSGKATAQALRGQEEAQEEANEASRQAQEEALKQKQAEREKQEAIERTRETLKGLGIDAQKVETGVSTAAREATQSLVALAQDGEASLNVLGAAAAKALSEFDETEIEAYRAKLVELLEQGEISKNQFDAMTSSIHKIGDELKGGVKWFDRLNDAISEASNQHDLGSLAAEVTRLGEAGELSGKQVEKLLDSITQAREKLREADEQQKENIQSTKELSESQAELGREIESVGTRAGAVGALIADTLNQLRALSEGAAQAVDEWVSKGTRTRLISEYLREMAEFSRQVTEEYHRQNQAADDLINGVTELTELQLESSVSAESMARSFDLIPVEKMDAVANAIRNARAEMERLQDSTRRGVETLTDELLRLQGKEDELEERRMERRRREIELQLAADDLDRESEKNLREQLRLLGKIEQEKEQQRKQAQEEAKREQRRRDQQERSSGGSQSKSASGGGAPRRIEIDLKTDQGDSRAPRMNPADLATLKRELTQSVLDEIRMQQRTGL